MRHLKKPSLVAIMVTALVQGVWSQDSLSMKDLSVMSLEDLLDIKIQAPASITGLEFEETPASITSITAEDIRKTPARNLYDIIEIYVPGAIWLNFEEGPKLGVRGSIINKNYKYLLLLNGKNINSKGVYGAKSELEHWDMADIQRIDVIRGPGSVTYGPGAVAGVINIITHTAETSPGFSAGLNYVTRYDSKGAQVSYGGQAGAWDLYAYGSVTGTEGARPRFFMGNSKQKAGYVGEGIETDKVPLGYFKDYLETPQAKVHLQAGYMKDWSLMLRYNQQGAHWFGNEVKTDFNGELKDQQGVMDRQFLSLLSHEKRFSETFNMSSMASAKFFDVERRAEKNRNPDPDHIQNFKINYGETEYFIRSLIGVKPFSKLEFALGVEYSMDHLGPGWGDNKNDFRTGGDGDIISDKNSNTLGPKLELKDAYQAGDGWTTHTMALFSEINYKVMDPVTLLVSGRMDKHTDTDFLFSPRGAVITQVSDHQILKLIAQKSLRMNTHAQMFIERKKGIESTDETLNSLELIYNGHFKKRYLVNLAGYWNYGEVIGWNTDVDEAQPLGNLEMYGFEAELFYKLSSGKLGVNYSVTEQLEWNLEKGVNSGGISYSDYNKPLEKVEHLVQKGLGNDLNNWSNHALKFMAQVDIGDKVSLHADAHFLWDYQGSKDGLNALLLAVSADSMLLEDNFHAVQQIHNEGAYGLNSRINLSLSWDIMENMVFTGYIYNLLGRSGSIRYAYDSGGTKPSPHRVRFIKEERALGLRLNYSL